MIPMVGGREGGGGRGSVGVELALVGKQRGAGGEEQRGEGEAEKHSGVEVRSGRLKGDAVNSFSILEFGFLTGP